MQGLCAEVITSTLWTAQKLLSPEVIFSPKCAKFRLAGRLCPYLLGGARVPQTPVEKMEINGGEEEGRGQRETEKECGKLCTHRSFQKSGPMVADTMLKDN